MESAYLSNGKLTVLVVGIQVSLKKSSKQQVGRKK